MDGLPGHAHNELFQPKLLRLPVPVAFAECFDFSLMHLPAAERAGENEAVWLGGAIFCAGKQGVDDAVEAIRKIQRNVGELAQAKKDTK